MESKDAPNFYVDAMSISQSRVHSRITEIFVIPKEQALNIEIVSDKKQYPPGEKAQIQLKVTDSKDNPFQGSFALSVYDKGIEYYASPTPLGSIIGNFWGHAAGLQKKYSAAYLDNALRTFSEFPLNQQKKMLPLGKIGRMHNYDLIANATTSARSRRKNRISRVISIMPMREMNDSITMEQKMERFLKNYAKSITTRKNFADTAYWNHSIETNAKGEASVEFDLPDDLTEWRVRCQGTGLQGEVGDSQSSFITQKPLMVRLETPRYSIKGDEITLFAIVHNQLKKDQDILVNIEIPKESFELITQGTEEKTKHSQMIHLAAESKAQVEWRVKALKTGSIPIRVKALAGEAHDGVERSLPIYPRGSKQTIVKNAVMLDDQEAYTLTLEGPNQLDPELSLLQIDYASNFVAPMTHALPYLISYPHDCVEQTLNKFVPLLICQKTLKELNISLEEMYQKLPDIHGTSDNELVWGPKLSIYNSQQVEENIDAGLQKLISMQNSDGGWGWFSGKKSKSNPYLTALVIDGLDYAKSNGLHFSPYVFNRGLEWLKQEEKLKTLEIEKTKGNTNGINLVTANERDALIHKILSENNQSSSQMRHFLLRDYPRLSPYGQILLALTLVEDSSSKKADLDAILNHLYEHVSRNEEQGTLQIQLTENRNWWRWYHSEIETNAHFLKLLSRTDPTGKDALALARYLLSCRKYPNRWNSTKDTAICVASLSEYITALKGPTNTNEVEIFLNGKALANTRFSSTDTFQLGKTIRFTGTDVLPGKQKIQIRKKSNGPLFIAANLSCLSLDPQEASKGERLKLKRNYYKIHKQSDGTSAKKLLNPDEPLKSGDLVEVVLETEASSTYTYIMLEDCKPAGVEVTAKQSTKYIEYRDKEVFFYLTHLPQGKQFFSYQFRAQTPGNFLALPARAIAMYAPEIQANSSERSFKITKRK